MPKVLFLLSGLLLLQLLSFGQRDRPDNGLLFLQDEVARVDITLPPDTFEVFYEDINYASSHEFRADFSYTSSAGTESVQDIGFRLRGNTSLQSAKKSFKVSFNTFTNGGSFQGVEKMNLNGEHNDPSILRAKLTWDMLIELGLPSCRTSHIELYVNGQYMGLYLNVEHIDEEYVKKRFGKKEGNLYKCLWGADLNFQGYDEENYQELMTGDVRTYDLKTNDQRDDYSDLAYFIEVLNMWDDEEFSCEIHRIFNVDDYLKLAAVEILVGHWDGYIVNNNNFYLYENPRSGRMEHLFYDPDNTYGIDWFGVDWSERDVYDYGFDSRPLYDRMMGIPEYRAQFSKYLEEMVNGYFSQEGIISHAEELMELITPYALADDFRTLDYGFSDDDFLNSLTEGWGNHVPQGIAEYILERRMTVLSQLESTASLQVVKETRDSLAADGSHILSAWTEGTLDELRIRVFENGDILYETVLTALEPGHYEHSHSSTASFNTYQFISVNNGNEVLSPCEPKRLWNDMSAGPLFINEFMASNSSTISDASGAYEDWIELYNAGTSSIYLGNKYLTDDLLCRDKWQMPDMFLSGGDFILIWADDDVNDGTLHTNFKLSAAGEELAIYAPQAGALRKMDEIVFDAQSTDISWGRETDAQLPWVPFISSTPNASNGSVGLEELPNGLLSFFHPNPSEGPVTFSSALKGQLRIWDSKGSKIMDMALRDIEQLDLSHLDEGLYLLEFQDLRRRIQKGRLVIRK